MPNRRKRILLLIALLLVAVGLVLILLPPNEPKYQGRYLSEWMGDLTHPETNWNWAKLQAAKQAVNHIGTNGVPMFVAWLSVETPPWKTSLRRKLPPWIAQKDSVANWLGRKDEVRRTVGMQGFVFLGTNAAAAIPELDYLMHSRTNSMVVLLLIHALTATGVESVPVLRAALADPKHVHRQRILWSLRSLAFSGHTNECMPTIIAALEDQDANVRSKATNLLQVTSATDLFYVPQD